MDPAALEAVKRNDLAALRRLVSEHAIDLSAVSKFDCTLMHFAAWHADAELVTQLATWETQLVDAVNSAKITPLHLAAERGDAEVIKALLRCGSQGHCLPDIYDYTPVDCARRFGHAAVVTLLTANLVQANKDGLERGGAGFGARKQGEQQ